MCIEGKGHFLTLDKGHLHMKLKTCFSLKAMGHFYSNFICKLSGHDDGHMTKMATTPIYGKNPSKISGISGPITIKLGM